MKTEVKSESHASMGRIIRKANDRQVEKTTVAAPTADYPGDGASLHTVSAIPKATGGFVEKGR